MQTEKEKEELTKYLIKNYADEYGFIYLDLDFGKNKLYLSGLSAKKIIYNKLSELELEIERLEDIIQELTK